MSHDNFQPPDPEEEPEDDKWERWFAEKEKNGYAVLSRDEWSQRLDEVATDGYAEGRKDQREESDARIKELRSLLQAVADHFADCGQSPYHQHSVPGVWDRDNIDELAGKPCEWCATWSGVRAALAKED